MRSARRLPLRRRCFSALQRAENSSILVIVDEIEQVLSFSALQRAENSSIVSSCKCVAGGVESFSALQRAENSSIAISAAAERPVRAVSVLFSEPKIPQSVALTSCAM